jgi:tetratricopeptide (TPR) repeat protein
MMNTQQSGLKLLPVSIVILIFLQTAAPAQHQHSTPSDKPAVLLPGMGDHHHPISTRSPEAQKFFDQGLALVYGFNRDEALRSFRRAAELDPQAAMPHWGIALATGPHINVESDGDMQPKVALEALEKARSLRANGPENERAYIEALARRFSADPNAEQSKLDAEYSKAMGELAKRYPDDLDAATLYAESLMNFHRWNWWSADGKPAAGAEEAVAVLESVLKRHPNHAGANHFYIHVIEASPNPERGLLAATHLMGANPGIGHMIHMPGHIFLRVGDYEMSAITNELAVKADRRYLEITGGRESVYAMGYYPHNIHFVAVARAAQGRMKAAIEAADELSKAAMPAISVMPQMPDYFVPTKLYVLLRFHRWDGILSEPAPDPKLVYTKTIWHYARALAFAANRKTNDAQSEVRAFAEARKAVSEKQALSFNLAQRVLNVPEHILAARLAADDRAAIPHWRKAVEAQDALRFDEPPPWHYPVRESLGGALLRLGQAAEAEAVFREDLRRNLRNPRSLFGLMESLKAQNKTYEAGWVGREFERAWKHAEVPLRIADF